MKRILPLLAVATACSPQAPGAGGPDTLGTVPAAVATITAADVRDRIAFLASDALRGRDTPSPGLDTAAQWIADELASFGVEPAGEDGWYQYYPYPAEALDVGETRLEASAGATHAFEYGRDFFASPGSAPDGAVGVVYVDSLPSDPDEILRGRAVMFPLHGLPEGGRRGFRFPRPTRLAAGLLAERAREAGAAAVVFVLDPRVTVGEVRALADTEEAPGRTLGGTSRDDAPSAFYVTRIAADRIFRMAEIDAGAVLDDGAQRPVPLSGVTLRLGAPYRRIDDGRAPNVVGLLRGSDPDLNDTYIVLSAHMDHVGVGPPDETGDSIYNGADDDASGTAVMVEVAQAMATLARRPRRSVLFLSVSGEEKGLLGSRWFSDHPTVPTGSMVANINLDMVGRNAPDSIVVIGQEYSSLGATLTDVTRRHRSDLRLTVSEDLWPEEGFFFRSDHFNFARREIPALFFFAGTHEDYHRPGDEVHDINPDKAARVGRLVFLLTHAIADDERPPQWDPEGLSTVRGMTTGQ